jgi:hypothetical protein
LPRCASSCDSEPTPIQPSPNERTEIVITKRGIPVARLVPVEPAPKTVLGCMVGTGAIRGDLVEPAVAAGAWQVDGPTE